MRWVVPMFLAAGCSGDHAWVPDPGTVTLHRLNRVEIERTIHDLFLTDRPVAFRFPDDDVGNGFDNQADVLSLSPLHLEILEALADEIVTYDVLAPPIPSRVWRLEAEDDDAVASAGGPDADGWNLWSNGTVTWPFPVADAGSYLLRARLRGDQAWDEPVRAALGVDGLDVLTTAIEGDGWQVVEAPVTLTRGYHTVHVAFLNDAYEPGVADRNLHVDWVEVEGPLDAIGDRPPGHDAVFVCDPAAAPDTGCAARIAREFGLRVWRRPLTDPEVASLVALYEEALAHGASAEEAVGWIVRALVVSPHFLYRVERDPDPGDPTPHRLTDFELASRLSYFLWSSTPDAELLAIAARGDLQDDEVLAEQVARMLADPRAEALIDGFGAQWLWIRAIEDAAPDPLAFPEWDPALRASMAEEARRDVAGVFLGDRSLRALLTSDTTWIDDRLARHYGLAEPGGWAEVSIAGTERTGLLTTGAWLTALSYPTRTSPVRRGAWILDNLLCEAPPPPPADVGTLEEVDVAPDASARERFEAHRADPTCNACHQVIDPIGFAFENFDGIGAWRNTDGGAPIDSSGTLPSGFSFDGPADLVAHLAASEAFDRCAVQKTFTWALGRAPRVEDLPYLDRIVAAYVAGDRRFEALATAIVQSDPFRMRRASLEAP